MRAVVMVALWALGCGAGAGMEPLSAVEQRAAESDEREPSASDYSAHVDVLALGYEDGTFEVRSPAPHHVISRGKHRAGVVNVALTRDGQRLVTADRAGTVAVSETSSGDWAQLEPLRAVSGPVGLGWDAEGKRLAVGTQTEVRLVELASGAMKQVELGSSAHAVAFAPGDRELVVGGERVTFLSVPDLKETRRFSLPVPRGGEGPRQVLDLRFSPDGRTLGVLLKTGVVVLDVGTGRVDAALGLDLGMVGLRFASDGKLAAFGRSKLFVGDANGDAIRTGMRETRGRLWDVEFRQDDSLLVFGRGVEDIALAP